MSTYVFLVHVGRKQNLVDLIEDAVNADVITVRHVRLIDEDAALKIHHHYKPEDTASILQTSLRRLKEECGHHSYFKICFGAN